MNWAHIIAERTKWPPHLCQAVLALAAEGLSATEIGRRLNMTKNKVVGWCYRNAPDALQYSRGRIRYDGPTTLDRLQQLHDRMDAVLAEWESIPRERLFLPPIQNGPGARAEGSVMLGFSQPLPNAGRAP